MKTLSNSIRSFVFSIVFILTISGIFTIPAFTKPTETVKNEITNLTICSDCYIIYVWIEGVRWAQVYDADGKMIDMYPDIEE